MKKLKLTKRDLVIVAATFVADVIIWEALKWLVLAR